MTVLAPDNQPDSPMSGGVEPSGDGPRWQLQLPLVPPRPGLPPIARPPVALQRPRTPHVTPPATTPEAVADHAPPSTRGRSAPSAPLLPPPPSDPSSPVPSVERLRAVRTGVLPDEAPGSLDDPGRGARVRHAGEAAFAGVAVPAGAVGLADALVSADPAPHGLEEDGGTLRRRADVDAGEVGPADPASAGKAWTRVLIEWVAIVLGALVAALVVKAFLLQAFVIPSRSMEPTLDVGDRVVVFKQSYRLGGIERGDVVVFSRPEELRTGGERSDLIKRVIGLAGDVVEAREGHLIVNGAELDEAWFDSPVRTDDFGPITVPEGTVWVMGDNRGNSQDSRFFGFLDTDAIRGEAVVRWWPLARFGSL